MAAKVLQICISETKGVQKRPVDKAEVVVGFGLKGDAHGGDWHRQVSLLADESAAIMREKGADVTDRSYLPTILLNRAWSESTPFEIETEVIGDGHYVQTIRRK